MSRRCCPGCQASDCCCPVLCGQTPATLDLAVDLTGWADWFHALASNYLIFVTRCSPAYLYTYTEYDPLYSDLTISPTLACCGTSADGTMIGCTWCANVPLENAFFRKRVVSGGTIGDWEDVPGSLNISVLVYNNGDGTLTEEIYIDFLADNAELINVLSTLLGACPPAYRIFHSSKIKACPYTFAVGPDSYTNDWQAFTPIYCRPGQPPCDSIILQTPAAPGSVDVSIASYVGGCTRGGCDEDCGTTSASGCLTSEEFATYCGTPGYTPMFVGYTNTGFSGFDLFTDAEEVIGGDIAFVNVGSGDPGEPTIALNCSFSGGVRRWQYIWITAGGCEVQATFDADGAGCPPNVTITSANADVWNMGGSDCDGVTEVNMQLIYLP